MTPEPSKKIEEVVETALKLTPGERSSFLDKACAGDSSLRWHVEALIASHENGESFVKGPFPSNIFHETLKDDSPASLIGRRIGAYKVVREIGRGGMGAVYLAVRADDEFQKRVAIKVVKHGMDTDFVVRRFRRERQILASLDHPNIAHLLDGGTTDDGLPFFVMEYVEGQPIHHYCDGQRLSTVARLELFVKVCAAVSYAHRNLIIHRDLKPTNIIVIADGTPKLLDFGIAKLLNPEMGSQTIDPTAQSFRLMTPEFASPEQARGETVTVATDIYSLGVLLYELLTGHRPYHVRGLPLEEMARVICEVEPARPSEIINRIEVNRATDAEPLEVTPSEVSQARNSSIEELRRQLMGDLDSIVLKALRKEPQRRYQSVDQLSDDINRYLEGLPVPAPHYFSSPNRPAGLSTDEAQAGPTSIAVLPFRMLHAEEGSDQFLGMGMADALITRLSNLRRIIVRPTSSVIKYLDREDNVLAAGRDLDVSYALDGRIQQAGERVRITVQLVRVSDGAPVWAGKFDQPYTDILSVQDKVSDQIARTLMPKLTGEKQELRNKRGTDHAGAYEAYLKGRYLWSRFTAEALERALEYFREAIRLDPSYGLAYAGVADYFNWAAIYGGLRPQECYPQAKAAALKALEIDQTLAEAHAALAFTTLCYDWDWAESERIFKRALELNPHYPAAHQWYSNLLAVRGRFPEAIREIKRAQELNPLSLMDMAIAGWTFYQGRSFDQAVQEARKALKIDQQFGPAYIPLALPLERLELYEEAIAAARQGQRFMGGSVTPLWVLGYTLAVGGKGEEARQILDELLDLATKRYVSPYYIALIYTGLGEREMAFEWLEKAYQARDEWLIWTGTEPKLDPLRLDPRFDHLLQRLGLRNVFEISDAVREDRPKTDEQRHATTLEDITSKHDRPKQAASQLRKSPVRRAALVLMILFIAAGGAAFVIYQLIVRNWAGLHRATPFQAMKVERLTATGKVLNAAMSPDGKYLAYVSDDGGRQSLGIRQVAIANNIQLIQPAEVDYEGLTFSPDGTYLYYSARQKSSSSNALYRLPVLGGRSRKILDEVYGPVAFSPDGQRFAFKRVYAEQNETAVIVVNLDGTGERKIFTRAVPNQIQNYLAWSPDGKSIAGMTRSFTGGRHYELIGIDVDSGTERQLSARRWGDVGGLAWLSNGSGLLLVGQDQGSVSSQIWQISYPGGEANRLTNDLVGYNGLSLAADSRTLLTVRTEQNANIWTVPNFDARHARQVTSGTSRFDGVDGMSWTPDGRVVFWSRASGADEIWMAEPSSGHEQQLTSHFGGSNEGVAVSPDGNYIVFASTRSGTSNIWRMKGDGSNPKQLTTRGIDFLPAFTPDGKWIIYTSLADKASIWRVSIEGGDALQLSDKRLRSPEVSPDGKLIACASFEGAGSSQLKIAVVPIEGGEPIKLFNITLAFGLDTVGWTPDGRAVTYMDTRDGVSNIWSQPLNGGPAKQLTDFKDDRIFNFSLSPDGKQLALSRGTVTSDIVLISDYR